MTAINTEHCEWAVVDRLRKMLSESPHEQYNVTQSYGLCVAILAWVMQRIRTPEHPEASQEDRAAISVKDSLESQSIENLPWGLKTVTREGKIAPATDFEGYNAFKFLKWLRDACCHGDARQVFPVNHGNTLVGFQFKAKAKNDRELSLTLKEAELRRIGTALADMYCNALQSASSSPNAFSYDANLVIERRLAA